MRYIDGETGLETERAKKIKTKLEELRQENEILKDRVSLLEQENTLLRDRITLLENENQLLKDRLNVVENGGLGVVKTSNGVEFKPSNDAVAVLTPDGSLKPITPNVLVIGDQNNYLNDVITANITVASLEKFKEKPQDLLDEELDIQLPKPKKYRRKEGKQQEEEEEIGFIAEELPPILKRGNGYDLKALVAVLAYKIAKLETKLRFSDSYQQTR